ncbi:MAG TPA: hypothetical protein VD948_05210 [Rhodothermales bacterium]|nr:hypothetical protein [Rhodothermales bacterium]
MTFGTGPFVLQPGAVQDVVFAFVWARGTDHLDSIAKLRRDAAALMDVWRSGGYMAYARQAASEPIEVPRPTLAVGAVMPSPVRGAASLRVSLPVAATVRVWVVDALGRTVARLHEGSMDMGTHPVALDGSLLAPGVYAARVSIGGETVSRPFVVVR